MRNAVFVGNSALFLIITVKSAAVNAAAASGNTRAADGRTHRRAQKAEGGGASADTHGRTHAHTEHII